MPCSENIGESREMCNISGDPPELTYFVAAASAVMPPFTVCENRLFSKLKWKAKKLIINFIRAKFPVFKRLALTRRAGNLYPCGLRARRKMINYHFCNCWKCSRH